MKNLSISILIFFSTLSTLAAVENLESSDNEGVATDQNICFVARSAKHNEAWFVSKNNNRLSDFLSLQQAIDKAKQFQQVGFCTFIPSGGFCTASIDKNKEYLILKTNRRFGNLIETGIKNIDTLLDTSRKLRADGTCKQWEKRNFECVINYDHKTDRYFLEGNSASLSQALSSFEEASKALLILEDVGICKPSNIVN